MIRKRHIVDSVPWIRVSSCLVVMMLLATIVRSQEDSVALLRDLQAKLGPEIDRFNNEGKNVGPPSPKEFYSPEIVEAFLVHERDRFLSLFTDARLRPLRLSVEARFDGEIAAAGAHGAAGRGKPGHQRPEIGDEFRPEHSPDPFVVSLVSRIVSCLKRIQSLPSLVTDLKVESKPPGAHVSLFIGNDQRPERQLDTDGEARKLYLGRYKLSIERKEYQARTMDIDLLDDPFSQISCTLSEVGRQIETICKFH